MTSNRRTANAFRSILSQSTAFGGHFRVTIAGTGIAAGLMMGSQLAVADTIFTGDARQDTFRGADTIFVGASGSTSNGSLTINGGSGVTLNSGDVGPYVYTGFGFYDENNILPHPAANVGTLTVTGTGSSLSLINNSTAEGAGIGAGVSGTGQVNITDGSSVAVSGGNGLGDIRIGSINGAGAMMVDKATVSVSGKYSNFSVGVNWGDEELGTGTASITNGSSVEFIGSDGSIAWIGRGGEGTGSLNVAANSSLDIRGATSARIVVGESTGAGSFVAASGSQINVASNGYTDLLAGNDSGFGEVRIESDAQLNIKSIGGNAQMVAGLFDSGNGSITLSEQGASVSISGSTAQIGAGWRSSTGTIQVEDGAVLTATGSAYANLSAGTDGGDGSFIVTGANSQAVISAGDGSANISIGRRDGVGTASISSGGALVLNGGSEAGRFNQLGVGEHGGTGTLTVDGGSVTVNSPDETFGRVKVGRVGGTGTIDITNGGSIVINSEDVGIQQYSSARFAVGEGDQNQQGLPLSRGTLNITDGFVEVIALQGKSQFSVADGYDSEGTVRVTGANSSIQVTGEADRTSFNIATSKSGSTGAVSVTDGADVIVSGQRASLSMGAAGNNANLTIDGVGTSAQIIGQTGYASIEVRGGENTLAITNGAKLVASSEYASFNIGRDGGTSNATISGTGTTVEITGNAAIQPGENSQATGLTVAACCSQDTARSTATLNISDNAVVTVSSTDNAYASVGRYDGADGTLNMSNGASLVVSAADMGRFTMGRVGTAGSISAANIASGSTISVTGSLDNAATGIRVAAAFGAEEYGQNGKATLTVSGEGSSVTTNGTFVIGAVSLPSGVGTAEATVTVENGGVIAGGTTGSVLWDDSTSSRVAQNGVYLGKGGTLTGNGGTIASSLFLDGGTIAPGASPGVLDITGDFQIFDGLLDFEFAGTEAGLTYDVLNIAGDFIVPSEIDMRFTFLNGFVPDADSVFDFINVDGLFKDLLGNTSTSLADLTTINLAVRGLEGASFDLGFGSDGSSLQLLTLDGGSVAPVPVPPALALLTTALAGLGFMSWRRKRRDAMAA